MTTGARLRRGWFSVVVLGLLSCCLAVGLSQALAVQADDTYVWDAPSWAPKPVVPDTNPMSAAKVELGRHLFYEKRLSVNGQQSCGSCHLQSLAFTDGKQVSEGTTGEAHPRSAMSLANVGYSSVLTWANPLMRHLEQQMLTPLFGEEPVELGMAGKESQILAMLRQDDNYAQMFATAFADSDEPISIRHLTFAIAAFERSLISLDSSYDSYRYGGDPNAISAAAKRGERLFHSEALECFHCHGGLIFSDSVRHDRLAFTEAAFHNTGLYNVDGEGAYPPNNTGVYEITHDPRDMGRFKAPSLRNIALTAPYMHDGSVATLEAAIAHYSAGGRTLNTGPYAGIGSLNPLKSPFIKGFELSEQEKQDLIAFLNSLTDQTFIHNPTFSNPFAG
ncbi:di-heme enzyme [filamentous cyanobacterium CCP5]|nr:di-heme enzyme [filamentous cyanobacterium CCP5]